MRFPGPEPVRRRHHGQLRLSHQEHHCPMSICSASTSTLFSFDFDFFSFDFDFVQLWLRPCSALTSTLFRFDLDFVQIRFEAKPNCTIIVGDGEGLFWVEPEPKFEGSSCSTKTRLSLRKIFKTWQPSKQFCYLNIFIFLCTIWQNY